MGKPARKVSVSIFDITVADIWSNLKKAFASGYVSSDLADLVLEYCKEILIKADEHSFEIDLSNPSDYDQRHRNDYLECHNTADYLNLDYFLNKNKVYSYQSGMIVTFDKKSYPVFFVLKLLSFESSLLEVGDFLGYQFQKVFSNKASEFYHFLQTCQSQYSKSIPEALLWQLQQWVKTKGHKKFEEPLSRWHSYLLCGQANDESYLRENNAEILAAVDQLKNKYNPGSRFIDPDTSIQSFRNLLLNKPVEPKINWIGTLHELKSFIELLIESGKVVNPGNYKWPIATKCFTFRGSLIKRGQLRQANAKHSKIDILQNIVKGLP